MIGIKQHLTGRRGTLHWQPEKAKSENPDKFKFKNLITNHFQNLSPAVKTGNGGAVHDAAVLGGGVRDGAVPKAPAKTNTVLARVGEVGKTGCSVTDVVIGQAQAAVGIPTNIGQASRQQLRESCTAGKVGKMSKL